jgi:RNA polymerase sigma factor (TIGR02999 family)
MPQEAPQEITSLLQAWCRGDEKALERLVPLVDGELRRITRRQRGKLRRDATLTTTALVNEAYVRLIEVRQTSWQHRAHFFALCARVMRGILVDHARAHGSAKRGGGSLHVPLDEALVVSRERSSDLVAIDDALNELAKMDPRKGRVVELRFFGGLTVEETAEVLSVSAETVLRDWRLARMWLVRELSRGAPNGSGAMATD